MRMQWRRCDNARGARATNGCGPCNLCQRTLCVALFASTQLCFVVAAVALFPQVMMAGNAIFAIIIVRILGIN